MRFADSRDKSTWLTMAAHNSSARSKQIADIVCDFDHDEADYIMLMDELSTGVIQLTEGDYRFDARVNQGMKVIFTIGSGKDSALIYSYNNDGIFKIGDGTSISTRVGGFSHIGLRGRSANNTGGSGIEITNGDHFFTDEVDIRDFDDYGIYFNITSSGVRCDYPIISRTDIGQNKKHGIYSTMNINALFVDQSFIHDNGTTGQQYHGIYLISAADFLINAFVWQNLGANIVISAGGAGQIIGGTLNTPQYENLRITNGAAAIEVADVAFSEAGQAAASTYPHIALGITGEAAGGGCNIHDCHVANNVTTPSAFVTEDATWARNDIHDNNIQNGSVGTITATGANSRVHDNIGWKTEASGSFTIANGATTVKVAHGLAAAPTRVAVTVTGWGNSGKVSVTSKDSDADGTKFTATADVDPGASTCTGDWYALVGER